MASFAAGLDSELVRAGASVEIVRVLDASKRSPQATTRMAVLHPDSPGSALRAADRLSRADVAVIHHEFGIYGGPNGSDIVAVLRALRTLRVPTIVVLHTVPSRPTPEQTSALHAICEHADRIVVMTHSARRLLLKANHGAASSTMVIPHGATVARCVDYEGILYGNPNAQLLTWGFIGAGKGIEHVIDAVGALRSAGVTVHYTVAGVTHPRVKAREGNAYFAALRRRAISCGVEDLVTFDETYRASPQITHFVSSASIVVLAYDSRQQVTSGVLAESIASGRPVIATEFPYAVELLSEGAGIIVPHGDPDSLAQAIRIATTDEIALARMTRCARDLAPSLSWRDVSAAYLEMCTQLSRARFARS